jgi:hypothetical protein
MRMRTSISLDDRLTERVRSKAAEEGLSVSAYIARILDDALKRPVVSPSTPFRLVTVGGEGTYPEVDLDRPRTLVVAEDEQRYGSDPDQS